MTATMNPTPPTARKTASPMNWWIAVVLSAAIVGAGIFAAANWITNRNPPPLLADVSLRTITIDGKAREYRLVVPHSLNAAQEIPVLFALHGALDTTSEMAQYSDLDRLAVKHRFLLVYLQGRILNWPPSIPPDNPTHIDADLHFFEAICDTMAREHRADSKRIYVIGVSQGGCMANLLTAKCSERIAATVCCCGWMPHPLDVEPLDTQNKCPILYIVGADDQQVPPEMVRKGHDAFARAGHVVEFRTITGLGHGWPRTSGTNDSIWNFLSAHRLP
jgi:poly(3-hydroxybutyrate) depolymerase